jgi:hypothetical protein
MYPFLPAAFKLLKKYRLLLKKQLSKEDSKKVLEKLQLDQALPKAEVSAYVLLEQVACHLKAELAAVASNPRFSGSNQLLQDMQSLLAHYHLKKDKLLYAPHEASRAMLNAIQLMVLPGVKRTEKVATQLKSCAVKVASYGMPEQKAVFQTSLEKHVIADMQFFLPVFKEYHKSLECRPQDPAKF